MNHLGDPLVSPTSTTVFEETQSMSFSAFDTFPNEDLERITGDVDLNFTMNMSRKPMKKPCLSSKMSQRKTKPKRPLTAYNFFFRYERARLVGDEAGSAPGSHASVRKRRHRKTHGKIGFVQLSKLIGEKWNMLDPKAKAVFTGHAQKDLERYKKEMKIYNKELHAKMTGSHRPAREKSSVQDMNKTMNTIESLFSILGDDSRLEGDSNAAENSSSDGTFKPENSLDKALSDSLETCEEAMRLCEDHEPISSGGSIRDLENELVNILDDGWIEKLSSLEDKDNIGGTWKKSEIKHATPCQLQGMTKSFDKDSRLYKMSSDTVDTFEALLMQMPSLDSFEKDQKDELTKSTYIGRSA